MTLPRQKKKEAKKSTGSLRREELDGMQTNPSTQNINSEQSRLSAVEWVQSGAIPYGFHVLGADGEPDDAVLTAPAALADNPSAVALSEVMLRLSEFGTWHELLGGNVALIVASLPPRLLCYVQYMGNLPERAKRWKD